MGGRALKSPTKRLDADTYHRLAENVADDVAREFGVRTHVVRAYRSKLDFGDLDLIVERAGGLDGQLDVSWTPEIGNSSVPDSEVIARLREYAKRYHSRDVYRERNSPVFTFEHRNSTHEASGFQVDLILAQPQDFDTTCDYFAFNDLGNLVGRLAHDMGCKYGFDGLHMKIADGTQHLETLCLSKDTQAIHRVLDLDHARFREGFDSMEGVFDFVMASKFFHPHLYKLENAGYRERARDRKRVNYSAFLDRCEQIEATDYESMTNEAAMGWLGGHFPELPAQVQEVRAREASRRELASWFNGRNIGEWTGMSGQALGELIGRLRDAAGDSATLIQWGPEEVRRRAEAVAAECKPTNRAPTRP